MRGSPPSRRNAERLHCLHPNNGATTFISVLVDAPLKLESILQKALTKNSDERYETIKEMLADLRNLKDEPEAEDPLPQTIRVPNLSSAKSNVTSGACYSLWRRRSW